MSPIDQIRDYEKVFHDMNPANVKKVIDTFGYIPEKMRMAVVIGRVPTTQSDKDIFERRMTFIPDVRIVPYDEILKIQHDQLS